MVFELVIEYVRSVTLSTKRLVRVRLVGALAIAGITPVWSTANANPYVPIVERNAFGLKPPPPPQQVEAPPPPALPAVQVKLTGISSLLNHKRALLEITEPGGKPAKKPILSEGEKLDTIEVVSIDVDKSEVVIRNSGAVTNLTFAPLESASAKSSPGAAPVAPGVPGMPSPFPGAPGFPSPAGGSAAFPSPTMINPGGSAAPAGGSGRNAIVLSGGGAATATPSAVPTVSTFGGTPSPAFANPAAALGGAAGASAATGLRTIPSRQIRTETGVPGATGRPMSREEALITIEAHRLMNQGKGLPPLPPTALTPFLQGHDTQ